LETLIPETLDDLKAIVAERIDENERLEFKRQLPESSKNEDLAKDLAIMANTEGGVIVYGIEEEDGKAKALAPLDIKGTPERIALISKTLDEPLTLGRVFTIEADDGGGKGFLVVEVPQSERAPHLYKGLAQGRAGRATAPLTRRQVGDLFARSPGFAEEFGLRVTRPGCVLLRLVREAYQESRKSFGEQQLRTEHRHDLVFENAGESDIFDVNWEWIKDPDYELMEPLENPFPVPVMHPRQTVPVRVHPPMMGQGSVPLTVRTVWSDAGGEQHERTWPITW
jgi:hypothetical protein